MFFPMLFSTRWQFRRSLGLAAIPGLYSVYCASDHPGIRNIIPHVLLVVFLKCHQRTIWLVDLKPLLHRTLIRLVKIMCMLYMTVVLDAINDE